MSVLALVFFAGVGVLIVIVVLGAVVVRRLSTSKHVIVTGRIDLVRAKARQEAAERAVGIAYEQHAQAARTAADAVTMTREALHVARQIDKVCGQLDALIGYVAEDWPELPAARGRHAVPGDAEWDAMGDLEKEFLR